MTDAEPNALAEALEHVGRREERPQVAALRRAAGLMLTRGQE